MIPAHLGRRVIRGAWVMSEWRDCKECGYRAPFDQSNNCLFCDASPGLMYDIDPDEIEKRALAGRAAATGDMVKSGLKLWFMSFFWRRE